MTTELAKYLFDIRNDLQTLADDCKQLDAAIEQFTRQDLQQRQRKWAA